MHKSDLISSIETRQRTRVMQFLDEQSNEYFNFINSLKSEHTKNSYKFCLEKLLVYYKMHLTQFLKLPQNEIANLIIKYLVDKKISKEYKNLMCSTLKHTCEINDVILNWKKIKKFVNSEKTGNETNGRDRAYTHYEIQKILVFCDQRIWTAFLLLTSTGIRIGALQVLKARDLEKVDDIYKIRVYSGDKEEYITFCTPECAREIDTYLEYRKRRGEKIKDDSYLIVKKLKLKNEDLMSSPFNARSLRSILQYYIIISGIREIDHTYQFKRKEVPIFHGFRKFFTTQLVNSRLNPEIGEMLLGHKIGLVSAHYKPTEQDMLKEYLKAVNLLTINEENRLKRKVEILEIEKSRIEKLEQSIKKLEEKYYQK